MDRYVLSEDEVFSNAPIEDRAFGINFVTSFDHEFSISEDSIMALSSLNPSVLRYPGGSVTEDIFTDTVFSNGDWEATEVVYNDRTVILTPMSELFSVAADVNSAIQLVIPTRIAFEESAAEAIINRNFGNRNEINDDYIEQLIEYIEYSISLSQEYGVPISGFEIGNEFWGSGEMSASEYGYLAGQLVAFLSEHYPDIDTFIQTVSSANLFSPREDQEVLIDTASEAHSSIRTAEEHEGDVPSSWISGVIPGQGNAIIQTEILADAFTAVPGAVSALDGIVSHVYFDGGFQGIDGERDFSLRRAHDAFLSRLGRSDLDFLVTEWSPRNRGATGNSDGLQYAHTTVEAFFELVSNGVDGANFWPTTFGSPRLQDRTLIDTTDNTLNFGGVAFQWLSQMEGMTPVLDYEVSGEIDIHGFSASDELALLVSERGGASTQSGDERDIVLDLGAFALPGTIFVDISRLSSIDGSVTTNGVDAVVVHDGGIMTSGGTIAFTLGAWELARVQIQAVTDDADTVVGSAGNDSIRGLQGNDALFGRDGHDLLEGQDGRDSLYGEAGDDTLEGGLGADRLVGGEGRDRLIGGFGDDVLIGGAGDDILEGGAEADFINGGFGDDQILLIGTEYFDANSRAFNASSSMQIGTGATINLDGMRQIEAVSNGGFGDDIIQLSNEGDALFLHDAVSEFHRNMDLALDSSGVENAPRLVSIETIMALGGDDLVDLTSPDFSLAGQRIEIHGGNGNDIVWGSDADEEIYGGTGNDTLFGGTGSDTLWGGSGADSFEFTRTSLTTEVRDFSPDEGDVFVFYNSADAVFDLSSLQWSEGQISIRYSDPATERSDILTIELSGGTFDTNAQINASVMAWETVF